MSAGEKLTNRQREALDAWSAFLYGKGYTTRQVGLALSLSPSTISNSLERSGHRTRTGTGRNLDMAEGIYADRWRTGELPPGTALNAGSLNQNGLLTSALRTWQARNALSTFANRAPEATDAEVKDGVAALESTIAYARDLQRVLTDPDFAKEVRADPSYRDDIGHRFLRV